MSRYGNLENNRARNQRHFSPSFSTVVQDLTGSFIIPPDAATMYFLDPGASSRTVFLPELSTAGGQFYIIGHDGVAGALDIVDSGGVAIVTLTDQDSAIFYSSPADWKYIVQAEGIPAPNDEDFLVKTPSTDLTAERVVTDSALAGGVVFDWTTAGQVSALLKATAADKYLYSNGVNSWLEGDITAAGRAVLDDADAAAQRTTLGLVIGTDVFTQRTLTGTADRITVTNGNGVAGDPTLDIAATYVGQATITTLGTVATGTWNATVIGLAKGGTGANLSATGGPSQVLLQETVGGTVTVGQLEAADLSNGITGVGTVVLATGPAIVGATITGVVDAGGATSFKIPNDTAPTVNADGEIAVDTSVTDFSHGIVKYFGGEEMGVIAMPIAQFTAPANGAVPVYNSTDDEFKLEVPAGGGDLLAANNLSDVNNIETSFGNIGFGAVPQGRITLTSGVPVLTTSVSGAGTVYYTPDVGNVVPIYNGTKFVPTIFTELSQATTDSTKSPAAAANNSNYDIFLWDDAGTLRATRGPAWTSDTGRGTGAGTSELIRVAGLLLNANAITNGPIAQRGTYVGTIRTNGSAVVDFIFGAVGASGTAGSFGLWNAFNRRDVRTFVGDSTDSWPYNVAAYRAANNSATMRVSFVRGLNEDGVYAVYNALASAFAGDSVKVAVGLDTTTGLSGQAGYSNNSSFVTGVVGSYSGLPGLGFHFVSANEYAGVGGNSTFYGDFGAATQLQTGLSVHLRL